MTLFKSCFVILCIRAQVNMQGNGNIKNKYSIIRTYIMRFVSNMFQVYSKIPVIYFYFKTYFKDIILNIFLNNLLPTNFSPNRHR